MHERPIAPHEKVRRDLEVRYVSVIRVGRRIEAVEKKIFDCSAAEFPRRKADRMDDEQIDRAAEGTLIAIGRWNEGHPRSKAVRADVYTRPLSFSRQARL